MLVEDGLSLLIQICFVLLAIAAVISFAQRRDTVRRDIALFFISIGMPLGIPAIHTITNIQIDFLPKLASFVFIAQPYLIVQLAHYLRFVPQNIRRLALASMFLSWAIYLLFLTLDSFPDILTLLFIVNLVIPNAYAVKVFIQGVNKSSGVLKRRLRFVTAGTGLFALVLVVSGLASVLTLSQELASVLILSSGLASAISFYLGFSTPSWLRKMWQFRELQNFLVHINQRASANSLTVKNILDDLSNVSNRIMSGIQTVIVEPAEAENQWQTIAHSDQPLLAGLEISNYDTLQMVWKNHKPAMITQANCASEADCKLLESMSARTLALVPITTSHNSVRVLMVFMEHSSLFPDDDLELLSLLTRQTTVFMENSKLVEQLRDYSASLEATNKELESFSYSVSHDLRAPLRTMNGFSQALMEDYYEVIDDEGKHFLNRIRDESQRMGQLIDGLLDLSKLTRADLKRQQVCLSEMVLEIVRHLQNREPERVINFIIDEKLIDCVDRHLIQIALSNFLENAWKYTRNEPKAIIEFGSQKSDQGEAVYFVRDNGVGFDMKYYNKLFGAFQRLHTVSEFEGTGIGLVTVQRVLDRHGGSVWAESAVGEGTTFFFTVGQENCE